MPYAKFRISGISGEETRCVIVYTLAEFNTVKQQLERDGYRHFNGICSVMSYEIA